MKSIGTGKVSVWQASSILRLIYKTPGITRVELSDAIGVNKSITTNITAYLEESGWILEDAARVKGVPLTINPKRLTVAGVIIQPEFCTLVICDLSGTVLHEETWKEATIDLETLINVVIPYRLHLRGIRVDALGIALPGIVDEETGTLLASQPLGINAPITLPDRIGSKEFPVFYANDARCIGWGRIAFEHEKSDFFLHYMSFVDNDPPTDSFARIIHGSAFFFGGSAFAGAHRCAGELRIKSHLAFAGSGEQYIDHESRMRMKSDQATLDRYLDVLAFNIAYVSTLIDVPKVYLFGSLERLGSAYGDKISLFAERISYYPSLQKVQVEFPGFTDRSVPVGAVGMAIERLFTVPAAERPTDFYRSILEGQH